MLITDTTSKSNKTIPASKPDTVLPKFGVFVLNEINKLLETQSINISIATINPIDIWKFPEGRKHSPKGYNKGKNKNQQGHELTLPPVASFLAMLLNPTIYPNSAA